MSRVARPFGALSLATLVLFLAAAAAAVSGQELSREDGAKLQQLFNAGNAFLNSGEAAKAVEKYTEAISVAPSAPLPYLNRGVAYLSLVKYAEALADADKALSLLAVGSHPRRHFAIAYQVKGTVSQNRNELARSVEFFSKSIDLDPDDAIFRNSRGNAYRLLRQPQPALEDYNKAIELDPSISIFYINRSAILLGKKDYQAALKDLDEALRLNARDSSAYYQRASVHLAMQDFAAAMADYDKAISLEQRPLYYQARGRVHFLQGRFEMSVRDNTEAIARDPAFAAAYDNRAIANIRLGKNKEALEDVRKGLALKPDSAVVRYTLAYLLYQTGQLSQALTEITNVIDAVPAWRDPYLLRSNVYVKLGNDLKAKADRAAAAKLGSGNRPADDSFVFSLDILAPKDADQ